MTNPEPDNGITRNDLLQRLELMETMIAEGRRFTARCGWIFVLWGLVDLAAMTWLYLKPHSNWAGLHAWPVCLIAGVILTAIGRSLQRREQAPGKSVQCRSVEAVWSMMGVALAILITGAMVRHLTWQYSYLAGLLIIIGMAHAISAMILRWRLQGIVAAVWWVGGMAMFFARGMRDVNIIMFVEMCLGMVLFGLYAMMLERRNGGVFGSQNA
jgi:hypothetical protein